MPVLISSILFHSGKLIEYISSLGRSNEIINSALPAPTLTPPSLGEASAHTKLEYKMASTEHTILTDFLLPPAPLPALISLKAFTGLFPHSQQSSPEIKSLYRDLQHQRATIIDSITQNIVVEVKRGNVQCRAVVKARRAAERELQDDEADVEFAVNISP